MKKPKKGQTVLYENLPIELNLGANPPVEAVGWSAIYRNDQTGAVRIEMELTPEASAKFQNLHEVFELHRIGFAGVARKSAS